MRRRIKQAAEEAQEQKHQPEPEAKLPPPTKAEVPLFENAPGQASKNPLPFNGPLPELSVGFQSVADRIFSEVSPPEDYDKMENGLALHEALSPGVLMAALNEAEDNARRAHRLYVAAKVAYARFEIDSNVTMGAMRSAATAALQAEKDKGQRNKTITDADVSDRAAIMWPDEWREASMRKSEASYMNEHLLRLADLWKQRCHSLSSMLNAGKN